MVNVADPSTYPVPLSRKTYIVEARYKNGSLNLTGAQPPFREASETRLFAYYFKHHPYARAASPLECAQWYASMGWTYREKTW